MEKLNLGMVQQGTLNQLKLESVLLQRIIDAQKDNEGMKHIREKLRAVIKPYNALFIFFEAFGFSSPYLLTNVFHTLIILLGINYPLQENWLKLKLIQSSLLDHSQV